MPLEDGSVSGDSTVIDWLNSTASIRTWAVAEYNDKGWPVTREDIESARNKNSYIACDPATPQIDPATMSARKVGKTIEVTWSTVTQNCVSPVIESIELCQGIFGVCSSSTQGSVNKTVFKYSSELPRVILIRNAEIVPQNHVYGHSEYLQGLRIALTVEDS